LPRSGLANEGQLFRAGGLLTFSHAGTTLERGSYAFTATASVGGKTSGLSVPLKVVVDTTNPTVTLSTPTSTVDPTPQLIVTATDNYGLSATTTVTLDVDLNNNGNFTDTGEWGYRTATMTNDVAVFNLSPALTAGTYPMRARVDDLAGKQGAFTDTMPQTDPLACDERLRSSQASGKMWPN
jgi:hypothetical protein